MVFNALCIDPRRLGADADRAEKRFNDLVALAAEARQFPTAFGEEDSAVGALLDVTLRDEPLEHLGDSRLGNPEALGDIDLPGLASVGEQVGDEFDVVLHKFAAAVVTCLLEALHLGIGGDK